MSNMLNLTFKWGETDVAEYLTQLEQLFALETVIEKANVTIGKMKADRNVMTLSLKHQKECLQHYITSQTVAEALYTKQENEAKEANLEPRPFDEAFFSLKPVITTVEGTIRGLEDRLRITTHVLPRLESLIKEFTNRKSSQELAANLKPTHTDLTIIPASALNMQYANPEFLRKCTSASQAEADADSQTDYRFQYTICLPKWGNFRIPPPAMILTNEGITLSRVFAGTFRHTTLDGQELVTVEKFPITASTSVKLITRVADDQEEWVKIDVDERFQITASMSSDLQLCIYGDGLRKYQLLHGDGQTLAFVVAMPQ